MTEFLDLHVSGNDVAGHGIPSPSLISRLAVVALLTGCGTLDTELVKGFT
jgi:hypothetical protein